MSQFLMTLPCLIKLLSAQLLKHARLLILMHDEMFCNALECKKVLDSSVLYFS